MKKYLLLGLGIILLGVFGARVWLAGQAADKTEDITPQELSAWVSNPDNAVTEIGADYFYMQEAIGSTGAGLRYPRGLPENFGLRFQLMSLTKTPAIRFILGAYTVELRIGSPAGSVKLFKGKDLLLSKPAPEIRPDIYYSLSFAKQGSSLTFSLNEERLINLQLSNPPQDFALEVVGVPDDPAAIQIRDLQIRP